MDIRCRKIKCKFNEDFTCKSKDINIGNDIECKCFFPEEKKVEDTSVKMFNKTPKVGRFRGIKDVDLKCSADCMFNRSKNCEANGITVNSVNECPCCMTYLGKKNNKIRQK